MSAPSAPGVPGVSDTRPRVRHQAREAVAVMVFSALTSVALAAAFLLVAALSHRG